MTNSPNINHINHHGTVIMVPLPIGSLSSTELSNSDYLDTLQNTKFWVAENARTFRRFISSMQLNLSIAALEIFELSRDYSLKELETFLNDKITHGNVGVVSEAGLPGIADPGSIVCRWASRKHVKIRVLSGPSSIFLSLAASGLNGQQFTFHGYPPVKDEALKVFLDEISQRAVKTGYTQIFIETPYRSDRMLQAIVRTVNPNIVLSISCALHEPSGWSQTQTVREWAKESRELGKNPCVFLLGNAM